MGERKGFTGVEFVVTAVIVLAVAVVVMVGIGPRVLKTGELGERFFPDKCAITGKTQEEHVQLVIEKIEARDSSGALTAYEQLKSCFPEYELPPEWRKELVRPILDDVSKLGRDATITSYKRIASLYYESLLAISKEQQEELFDSQTLLVFARALVVQGHSIKSLDESRADALRLVEIIAKKAKSEKNKLLEAETLSLAFLKRDLAKSEETYIALVKNFAGETGPEFQYFVGSAYRSLHKLEESVKALKEGTKSSDSYIASSANYELAMAYFELWLGDRNNDEYQQGLAQAAESILENPDVLYSDAVIYAYSRIPSYGRKYADCETSWENGIDEQCLCQIDKSTQKVLRAFDCICKIPEKRKCERYSLNEQLCDSDPCGFRRCRWIVSRTTQGATAVCGTMP